jgi:hypothetical protein
MPAGRVSRHTRTAGTRQGKKHFRKNASGSRVRKKAGNRHTLLITITKSAAPPDLY